MEIEVKKNEKGDLICEMKEGINAGTKVNINELMRLLGEDLTNGILLQELGIIGTRYAIYAIESNYMSILESDIVGNLRTIENLFDAFAKNVTSANWYDKTRKLNEDLDFYQSEYNQLKRHKQLLKESIEENDRLLDAKIAEIENLKNKLTSLQEANEQIR